MRNKVIFVLLLCLVTLHALAQKVDVDELLKQATYQTNIKQNYPNAIVLAKRALAISPDYTDVRLLLAKLYKLTNQPERARAEYNRILEKSPTHTDALAGVKSIDNNEQEQKIANLKNRLTITYNPTFFEKDGKKAWNLISTSYAREEKFGSIIGRINYLDRAYASGYQFEVEAYPKHKKAYSYLNFAYSNAAVFQKYKASYSYIKSFPKGWEGELGIRYQYNTNSLFSYGGAVGKYFQNYWVNLKAFVTPSEGKIAQSYTLTSRYYFNTADDYVTAIIGTGVSPDDRTRNSNFSERLEANAFRLSLGYQKLIWSRNTIAILGTYNRQEYIVGKKENEYDFAVSFQHRF
ncbi:YaiO family outer membrane beta-barrel protein [Pedobacter polaris]|uniref:YaiO family outer membrane beta-barrel protein n=1 Tax=Pedobacter polaris TaxID=2571273 RepID=A0A4U1CYM2_9SPHI|nr:YaiO family outer membrane beta-barrel protein [Pedobacter polaris]TKC12749.1 YaiO family outer membrane beta-barrel protein [Pedobacter polaris]